MTRINRNLAILVVLAVVVLDFVTKRWALATLSDGTSLQLFGGLVPITLAFNQGAAFGLTIGSDPRWIFVPITLVAMAFLLILIRQARPGDFWRVGSASLVLAGACGNLYDRLRWNGGVIDFIGPIDLGFMDWPIFNVADSAITCGAILLAFSFWREDATRQSSGEEGALSGERSVLGEGEHRNIHPGERSLPGGGEVEAAGEG